MALRRGLKEAAVRSELWKIGASGRFLDLRKRVGSEWGEEWWVSRTGGSLTGSGVQSVVRSPGDILGECNLLC